MQRRGGARAPRQKIERGPVSENVALNVSLLRTKRGISQQDLSKRLGEVGRPMLPSALSKIESRERGVDVDDLVALAVALGVNPSRLLLPFAAWEEDVQITPEVSAPAWAAWQWADGFAPLPSLSKDEGYNADTEVEDFELHARPAGARRELRHPLMRAARDLLWSAARVIDRSDQPGASLTGARRNLQRVALALDEIEEQVVDRGQR
jgi:transcriptional regulator with XRE-family HTH domain